MATFVIDRFSAPNWYDVNERSGDTGATWTYHPAVNPGNTRWYVFGNRVHCGVWGAAYASGVPDSADYSVTVDMVLYSNVPGLNSGPCVRMSTSADTYYSVYYQDGELVLIKRLAGVTSTLGAWVSSLTYGGTTYEVTLEASGTTIRALVNGTERISATDGDITAAGRVGLRGLASADASTGVHFDRMEANDGSVSLSARPRTMGGGLLGI